MTAIPGSIAFDEFGRPFIILRDQDKQKRLTGNDAVKVCITSYRILNRNINILIVAVCKINSSTFKTLMKLLF